MRGKSLLAQYISKIRSYKDQQQNCPHEIKMYVMLDFICVIKLYFLFLICKVFIKVILLVLEVLFPSKIVMQSILHEAQLNKILNIFLIN